jgi:manganese transport protein
MKLHWIALFKGGTEANYTLIHVVETVGALVYGENIEDHEKLSRWKLLEEYKAILSEKDLK